MRSLMALKQRSSCNRYFSFRIAAHGRRNFYQPPQNVGSMLSTFIRLILKPEHPGHFSFFSSRGPRGTGTMNVLWQTQHSNSHCKGRTVRGHDMPTVITILSASLQLDSFIRMNSLYLSSHSHSGISSINCQFFLKIGVVYLSRYCIIILLSDTIRIVS